MEYIIWSFGLLPRMKTYRENSPVSTVYTCEKHHRNISPLHIMCAQNTDSVCHVGLSSRITSHLHLEIVAKTVIPGYNVVGTN